MANVTNKSVFPPMVRDYASRLLLMTAKPDLVYHYGAQKRAVPKNSGDTIVMRRIPLLDTVTAPLQDGVTPPGATLNYTDIKVRLQQYGNFILHTDQVEYTVEGDFINDATRTLGQNMGQTLDEITRDALASTSTVLQAANGNNGGTPTNITDQDLDVTWRTLVNNNAKMFTETVPGSDKFGTVPVRPSFYGVIHSELLDDLENLNSFISTANYGSQQILPHEWGSTSNIRWRQTSIGSKATSTIYNTLVYGKEAHGVVNLGADAVEMYVKPLGSSGADDPLDQRGSIGWKAWYAARLLNDLFATNLMCTHS